MDITDQIKHQIIQMSQYIEDTEKAIAGYHECVLHAVATEGHRVRGTVAARLLISALALLSRIDQQKNLLEVANGKDPPASSPSMALAVSLCGGRQAVYLLVAHYFNLTICSVHSLLSSVKAVLDGARLRVLDQAELVELAQRARELSAMGTTMNKSTTATGVGTIGIKLRSLTIANWLTADYVMLANQACSQTAMTSLPKPLKLLLSLIHVLDDNPRSHRQNGIASALIMQAAEDIQQKAERLLQQATSSPKRPPAYHPPNSN